MENERFENVVNEALTQNFLSVNRATADWAVEMPRRWDAVQWVQIRFDMLRILNTSSIFSSV